MSTSADRARVVHGGGQVGDRRARTAASRRIPSLDGLRAVSITAVLLGHAAGTRGFPGVLTAAIQNPYVDIANLGVRVFFVISGFLITGLLMAEAETTAAISLSRFYLRRSLRIFPAYLALLGVIAALDALQVIAVPSSDFLHALTYTINYEQHRSWYLGHLWSLAVEEQFYLLWPAAVAFVTVRNAWRVALTVVCMVPFIRVLEATLWHNWIGMIGLTFETTADALAIGCLLALTRERLFGTSWYRRAVLAGWPSALLLLLGIAMSTRYRAALLLGQPLVNLAIVMGVDHCVRRPAGRVGRWLNSRPLVYVGTLSYSLYLWQQLFLNRGSTAAAAAFPLNVVLAGVCALLSYYLVERPTLRLRPRVEKMLRHR